MKKVTIKDVARLAGVSEATVSRVMSNSPFISEKTKNRVMKIIKELDYYPNSAAISLTKSSSKIIGVVVESKNENPLYNDFFIEILSKISNNAMINKYYTLYAHFNSSNEREEKLNELIKTNRIDGIIFLNLYEDEKTIEYLKNIPCPYVILGRPKLDLDIMWVDNNNEEVTYKITKKLIEKGNKKIAFLSGPIELSVSSLRKKGYEEALLDSGIEINLDYQLSTEFDINLSYDLMEKFLSENEVDAVVTTDDILAIGTSKVIKNKNLDIEVTGFNNSKLRSYLNYDFLTVDIRYDKLAKSTVSLLIDKLENKIINNKSIIVESQIID